MIKNNQILPSIVPIKFIIEIVAIPHNVASFFEAVLLCVTSFARSKADFTYLLNVSLDEPANSTAI